jgi:hypothetical protein
VIAPVGQRRVIDHVVGVPSAQQIEEVQTALAARRAEPGEMIIAELRAGAVAGLVARAGIIHAHPGRIAQSGAQNAARFRQEAILAGNQQTHHLPPQDIDADGSQLGRQPSHGDLALGRLRQHEAAQFGSEVTDDPCRQQQGDRGSLRCQPTLAAIGPCVAHSHRATLPPSVPARRAWSTTR